MVSPSAFACLLATAEAWQSYVSYNGELFAMTETAYNFTNPIWKNEDTITFEAAAARCLSHGDDCVGFYRADVNETADTHFVPATSTVTPVGPNADNCGDNCSGYVYFNRSFVPVNGRVKSLYTGMCMEAVPVADGVMKIVKKECGYTSFQRWMINETAMVFDGGVGRDQIVSPAKGADWKGAELFVWDAMLHTISGDVTWEFTGAGQLKMNSKWKHGCVFTDKDEPGMRLWDCDDGGAQQWSLGLMDSYSPWGGGKNLLTGNTTQNDVAV